MAHLGEQLALIEDQLDPTHRTAKPASAGAFPTCTALVTTPTREPGQLSRDAGTPARVEGRPFPLPAAESAAAAAAADLPAAESAAAAAAAAPSAAAAADAAAAAVPPLSAAVPMLEELATPAADSAAAAAAAVPPAAAAAAAAAAAVRPPLLLPLSAEAADAAADRADAADAAADLPTAAAVMPVAGSLMDEPSVANATVTPSAATDRTVGSANLSAAAAAATDRPTPRIQTRPQPMQLSTRTTQILDFAARSAAAAVL